MNRSDHSCIPELQTGSSAWFPVASQRTTEGLRVEFIDFPPGEFIDPFSHETTARCAGAKRAERLYRFAELEQSSEGVKFPEPRGLIFHAARVGSTLQAACLRCVDELTVYSEPMVLNDYLNPGSSVSEAVWTRERMLAGLRLLFQLLGRHSGRPYVIKLRSWNCLYADLICEALPKVPWVFTVRDPVEIGVSVERKPPTWMRAYGAPLNPFLNFCGENLGLLSREAYFATMIGCFSRAVCGVRSPRGLLIHYQNLPEAIWERLLPHFGFEASPATLSRMREVSRFNSKAKPGEPVLFQPDRESKRRAASEALRHAVETLAYPALYRLEYAFAQSDFSI